ncbi:MAG: Microbial serine proteinase precursor [Pseudomonadota bacterium]|jgi:subtilisin-like proprotein convertase family protein
MKPLINLILFIVFIGSGCSKTDNTKKGLPGNDGVPTGSSGTTNEAVNPPTVPTTDVPPLVPTETATPQQTATPPPSTEILLFEAENQVAYGDFLFTVNPQTVARNWSNSGSFSNWRGDNFPIWLSINSTTGQISGVPPSSGTFENLSLRYTSNNQDIQIGPFSITVKSDPFFSDQWGLVNTGQRAYSQSGGKPNEDLHVLASHQAGYSGKNILIGVSDTGFDVNHEDLAENVKPYHRDYINGTLANGYSGVPTPTSASYAFHGTGVAGLIAAVGWNDIGVRGVAPRANIASLNFIESDQSINKLIDQVIGPYDIINQSWGASNSFPMSIEAEYRDILKSVTSTQRNGRGTLVVKAAGNGYLSCGSSGFCPESANQDQYNNNPYTIVVGALSAQGVKASYSSIGSSLWISAPGGEFGTTTPAMVTTDLYGCDVGLSRSSSTTNDFNSGVLAINNLCRYTSAFNGTSSATPMASGAIALLLEGNPQLTWRDVKHILAKTARRIEPSSPAMSYSYQGQQIEFSLGWVTNAAGIAFHNHYGFGALDISAALTYARSHTLLPPATEHQLGNTITSSKAFGTSSAISATEAIVSTLNKTVETLELEALVSHSYFGDVAIEIISPAGTRSIVMPPFNTYSGTRDGLGNPYATTQTYNLISNAFYGEPAAGTWTVKFLDQIPDDEGQIQMVKLKALAH